jgi:hypothetical protein
MCVWDAIVSRVYLDDSCRHHPGAATTQTLPPPWVVATVRWPNSLPHPCSPFALPPTAGCLAGQAGPLPVDRAGTSLSTSAGLSTTLVCPGRAAGEASGPDNIDSSDSRDPGGASRSGTADEIFSRIEDKVTSSRWCR